jgi:hypothetical protein
MDNMKKNYSDSAISVKVGDQIILDDQGWKVAEIISDTVVLYRESVSGKSQTMQKPVDVIKSHLQEQKNQDI